MMNRIQTLQALRLAYVLSVDIVQLDTLWVRATGREWRQIYLLIGGIILYDPQNRRFSVKPCIVEDVPVWQRIVAEEEDCIVIAAITPWNAKAIFRHGLAKVLRQRIAALQLENFQAQRLS